MPWTPKEFASRHNHSLSGSQAKKASSIANAMLGRGVPEGEAIATANKRAGSQAGLPSGPKRQPTRMAGSSPANAADHMKKRRGQGVQLKGIAREFGTSKSTAHRKTGGNMFRQGFVRGGSAAD